MLGWGYVPIMVPSQQAAAAVEDHVEVIQLVTNRASAPSLGDFLAELHNSEVLSDITICAEDGQAIKCHKLVLIRWSAPLRRMLCGDMREAREQSITLHGVDGEVLAAFIRFLYTCHCSIAPDKLVGLAAMADQYDVTLLQQLCMDAIRMHATNHRCCCLFYKAAKDIQQQEIQELAWEQLSSNLHTLVQQHDVFVQLEFEDVLRLFSNQQEAAAAAVAAAAAATQPSWQQPQPAAAAAGRRGAAACVGRPPQWAAPRPDGRPWNEDAWAQMNANELWGRGPGDDGWRRLGPPPAAAAGAGAGAGAAAAIAAARDQARVAALDGGGAGEEEVLEMLEQMGMGQAEEPHRPHPQPLQAAAAPPPPAAAAAAPPPAPQVEAGADYTRQDIAAAYQQTGRPLLLQQPHRRPEYALFLACMAWLHHLPERQQHKQQLYHCFDFNAMRDNELSQMRRNAHVQADPDLKEMLLDAFERRCLAHSQQPVYHMGPLPSHGGWGVGAHPR